MVYGDVVLTADLAVKPAPKPDEHRSEVIAFSAENGREAVDPRVRRTVRVSHQCAGRQRARVVGPHVECCGSRHHGSLGPAGPAKCGCGKPPETPEMLGMSHHRCYRDRATERYLVLGRVGVEFLDTQSGEMNFNHFVRGECQFGVLPCNGLLYVTPHPGRVTWRHCSPAWGPWRRGEPEEPTRPAGASGRSTRTWTCIFRDSADFGLASESRRLADLPPRCGSKRNHAVSRFLHSPSRLASGYRRPAERLGRRRGEVVRVLDRHAYRAGP